MANIDNAKLDAAIAQLAKEYSLNETEKTFISWYAHLDQEQRVKIFPILMEATLEFATEMLTKRK